MSPRSQWVNKKLQTVQALCLYFAEPREELFMPKFLESHACGKTTCLVTDSADIAEDCWVTTTCKGEDLLWYSINIISCDQAALWMVHSVHLSGMIQISMSQLTVQQCYLLCWKLLPDRNRKSMGLWYWELMSHPDPAVLPVGTLLNDSE